MQSKRAYKICICSVILGERDSGFSKLEGLQFYFPESTRLIKLIKFISLSPRDMPRDQRHNLTDLTNKKGKYNIK